MTDPLLLRAIAASSSEEAWSAWSEWRSAVDLADLPWATTQVLPAVCGRLNGLLAGDPSSGIVHGIVRRAWTEAQLRLGIARGATAVLREAGCEPVALIGGAGVFLLTSQENNVRPVTEIKLLIRREQVELAVQSLTARGWSLSGSIPRGGEFDWSNAVSLSRDGVVVHLSWRPILGGDRSLEKEVLKNLQQRRNGGHEYTVLTPEMALLAVLGGDEDGDPNAIPWQVDAALLAREPLDRLRLTAMAREHAPAALRRTKRLRELGLSLDVADEAGVDQLPLTVIDGANPKLADWAREHRDYSTLLRYLTVRDLRLRFRNLSLGLLWTILQPLLPAVIFALVFARVLQPTMRGVPYSLFAAAGLALWTFFSSSVSSASMAFVWNANLLHKVFFPRAILPASAILASSVELAVSCVLLVAYAAYCGYPPRRTFLLLPVLAAALVVLAFLISLALATLNALHREVKFAVPFALQVWMYMTPVVYPASLLPEGFRWIVAVNPLTWILEVFRWALFGLAPDRLVVWTSVASAVAVAAAAAILFRSLESALTDRL